MRRWASVAAVLLCTLLMLTSWVHGQVSTSVSAQNAPAEQSSQGTWHEAEPEDRMFFPRDMLWGWAQVDLAPPHNEIDPNL